MTVGGEGGVGPRIRSGSIVVISDRIWHSGAEPPPSDDDLRLAADPLRVAGSYLERLPLALIASGRFNRVEIWHHVADPAGGQTDRVSAQLSRRGFYLEDHAAPFDNAAMARCFMQEGPPELLIVYGLGVSPQVLEAAEGATIVYNSIDAPALRVPFAVSALCDIILTGAQWQADAVHERHHATPAPVLPVGPEFAAPDQFYPTETAKDYDLIYVGAAQPYKRHDILFDAIERLDGAVNALCVFGYGELAEQYRQDAHDRNLPIDFVMPPVVSLEEVNRLMNRSRIGVVAGVDDGAPAILTEYMLAGLPVLANAHLSCGLQYITPETGEAAPADEWSIAIPRMLDQLERYAPRETAIARWSWPISVGRFLEIYDATRRGGSASSSATECRGTTC